MSVSILRGGEEFGYRSPPSARLFPLDPALLLVLPVTSHADRRQHAVTNARRSFVRSFLTADLQPPPDNKPPSSIPMNSSRRRVV